MDDKKVELTRERFVQKTYSMGTAEDFQWDQALETATALEDNRRIQKLASKSMV